MAAENSPTAKHAPGATFVEAIDRYLDELSGISSEAVDRVEFYRHLCERLQLILDADEVGIWLMGLGSDCVRVISASAASSEPVSRAQRICTLDTSTFSAVVSNQVGSVIVDSSNERSANILAAIVGHDAEPRVLRIVLGKVIPGWMPKFCQNLCLAVAEIATNFERRWILDQQQRSMQSVNALVRLLKNAGSTLELEQFGFHVTNDTRALLVADRVWLFSWQGRPRLVACSGVNNINPGSRVLRSIRRVAQESARKRRSIFWHRADGLNAVTPTLKNHLQQEQPYGLYVALLANQVQSALPIGIMIAEYFSNHDRMDVVPRLNELAPLVGSSLSNVLRYSRIPFRTLLQAFSWVVDLFRLRLLPRTAIVLGLVAAGVWLASAIQTDFTIEVQGQVRPLVERHVFAPADGTVQSVLVDYGDQVTADQPLVILVSKDYELRRRELENELATARKELQANQLLLSRASQDSKDSLYSRRLSAEIEQNRLAIESITNNIDWLLAELKELTATAPIAGRVVSRDVRLSLLNRPVSRGSRLLTIADTLSPWQVEFDVPDKDLGYLLQAQREQKIERWRITYRLHSDLDEIHTAAISRFDDHNTVVADGRAIVKAYVPVEIERAGSLRIGQSVSGRVDCGRRSLLFVWTRELRDFLRSHFFWI